MYREVEKKVEKKMKFPSKHVSLERKHNL